MSILFTGSSAEALQDPAVAQLSAWGYPVSACVEALQRLKGHPDAAHQDLFARLSGKWLLGAMHFAAFFRAAWLSVEITLQV